MAPGSSVTTTVSWSPPDDGDYALYARIDPANQVAEYDESNNQVSRLVVVSDPDPTPPVISNAGVADMPGAGDGDGQVETGEAVLVYWTAADAGSGVLSTTVQISGAVLLGLPASCPAGYQEADRYCALLSTPLLERTYQYTIEVADNSYERATASGSVQVLPDATSVMAAYPAVGSTGVPVGTAIYLQVNPPLSTTETMLPAGSFVPSGRRLGAPSALSSTDGEPALLPAGVVTLTVQGKVMPAIVSWDASGQALMVEAIEELPDGAPVTATVRAGAAVDMYGNHLADDQIWTFATEADSRPPLAVITAPAAGDMRRAIVTVFGSAVDKNLLIYTLDAGPGAAPLSWTMVHSGTASVVDDVLGVWSTAGLADGAWTLRLVVTDTVGTARAHRW